MTQAVSIAQSGSNNTTFRNRIINGGMMIDQRNAGASSNPSTDGGYWTVDRWRTFRSQASKYTIQQNAGAVTPPAGFGFYMGVTSSSAYSILSTDYFMLNTRVEGFNWADMNWGTASASAATLSFWVRSSLTGTFGGSITNGAENYSYPFTYTVNSANTWEYKTVAIPAPTAGTWVGATNGIGVSVWLGLGVGSTYSGSAGSWSGSTYYSATGATSVVGTNGATFYITGVQLEKGSTATSFDYRPYGTELALCQRYFETSFDIGIAPANNTVDTFQGTIHGSNGTTQSFSFKAMKRAAPTMTYYSSSGFVGSPTAGQWQGVSASNVWSNGSLTQTNRSTMSQFQVFVLTSLTGGQAGQVAGGWTASAEL